MKKLRITVDGRVFDVTVETTDAPAAAPRSTVSAPASSPSVVAPSAPVASAPASVGAGAVCSPLAGKIVSVDVLPGATVAAGTQLVTIEAMKMNTFVYADRAGTVTSVSAKPGDAVEEGAALLIIG